MTGCQSELSLDFYHVRPLTVQFSGQDLSSDAGLLLVRQADERLGICRGLAQSIGEWRDGDKLIHPLTHLVSQRVYQLVGGYENANDSNQLRHDPIYKIACDRLPHFGKNSLASQPTITRLENHVSNEENSKMRRFFVDHFIARYDHAPESIYLDIDGWDAPTYGEQQLSLFHGYYGQSMYFPVLINEASTGYPLVVQLRAGNSHPGKGVVGLLRWIFWRLRRAWPDVKLYLRADAGFALPEILQMCERAAVGYVIGFASNAVLKRKIEALLEQARVVCCLSGEKARLFDDVYYQAGSWDAPRRMVMKAEWLLKGPNPRFVITNLDTPAHLLYDSLDVQRGADSEHRIKELKRGIHATRLSCRSALANQFRLLLSQAAYVLMLALRQSAHGTQFASAQVSRLRSALIKAAARVTVSVRRVLVEFAAFSPFADEMRTIAQRLNALPPIKLS